MQCSPFKIGRWDTDGKGNKMTSVELTTEEAESLQNFVTDHINTCLNSIYEDEGVPEGWEPYELFCGCDTCVTRENLMSTFDWLKKFKGVDVYVRN